MKYFLYSALAFSGAAHAQAAPTGEFRLDDSGENLRFGPGGEFFHSAYGDVRMLPGGDDKYQITYRSGVTCVVRFARVNADAFLMWSVGGGDPRACRFGVITRVPSGG